MALSLYDYLFTTCSCLTVLVFAEMTFDPAALRKSVHSKSKTFQARTPRQKRGKKWPRATEKMGSGVGESSRARSTSPGAYKASHRQQSTPRVTPQPHDDQVVDLEMMLCLRLLITSRTLANHI